MVPFLGHMLTDRSCTTFKIRCKWVCKSMVSHNLIPFPSRMVLQWWNKRKGQSNETKNPRPDVPVAHPDCLSQKIRAKALVVFWNGNSSHPGQTKNNMNIWMTTMEAFHILDKPTFRHEGWTYGWKEEFLPQRLPPPPNINMSLENGPFKRNFHVPTINFFTGQTSSFWWDIGCADRDEHSWAAMTIFPVEWRANGCNWGWWALKHWLSNSKPADKILGWLSGKKFSNHYSSKGFFLFTFMKSTVN